MELYLSHAVPLTSKDLINDLLSCTLDSSTARYASWRTLKIAVSFHANRDPFALFVKRRYVTLAVFTHMYIYDRFSEASCVYVQNMLLTRA